MNIMTNTTGTGKTVAEIASEQGLENVEVRPIGGVDLSQNTDMTSGIDNSPVTNMILNDVASEYEMRIPSEGERYSYGGVDYSDHVDYDNREKRSLYENDMAHQRNQEGYPDRTYHGAARRYNGYSRDQRQEYKPKGAPHYIPTRSRRFEVIGMIMRLVDLAGFELVERVVLRDKETGEILR